MSKTLPIVPMRSGVLFPGREPAHHGSSPETLRAIEAALRDPEHRVFAVAQRDDGDEVTPDGLYTIGTIATLGSVQRGLGGVRVVLEGHERGIAMRVTPHDGYLVGDGLRGRRAASRSTPKDPTFVALHREVRERAAELAKKRGLPDEAVEQMLTQITEPGRLADLVAGYLDVPVAERQALLETLAIEDRLRRVLIHVQRQIDVLSAQEDIQSKVKEELGDRQREVYLREQLQGDPEGARRGRRGRRRGAEGAQGQARRAAAARRGAQGGRSRVVAADAHRPRVDGVAGDPHVPRDDRGAAVGHAHRRAPRRRRRPRRSSTRITTASAT